MMKIYSPCCITSRLLPGIRIGGVEMSIDIVGSDHDGRDIYRLYFDGPDFEIEDDNLRSGCQDGSLQDGLCSAISFLGAFAESWQYSPDGGGENCDLFDLRLKDWATENSDELSMIAYDIEENEMTVIEEE